MELILLGIYAAIVWFIFIKMKWLPWNTVSQVIVVIIPIVGAHGPHPDPERRRALFRRRARHQVRGEHRPAGEGPRDRGPGRAQPARSRRATCCSRSIPTPYQLQVNALEAQLANAIGTSKEQEEQLAGAAAQVAQAKSAIEQAMARVREVSAKVELARLRVEQNRELVTTGAGNKFDLDQAEANLKELEGQLDGARSAEAQSRSAQVQAIASQRQVVQRLGAKANGEYAQVAQVRAQLESAKWDLSQTTVTAPANGYAINLQLRPGSMTAAFPALPVAHLRRGRVHGDRPLQPERAAPGRARQRRGNRAQDLPGPHHQGQGRFGRLGAGPGPVRRQHEPADDRTPFRSTRTASR